MRRSNKTSWLDHDHWSCGRHLPAGVLPATVERCWLCPNKRPPMKDRPAPPTEGGATIVRETGKKKAQRPLKPKMIVARKQAGESTDALASMTSTPPPPHREVAPTPAQKTSGRAAQPSKAAVKSAPIATPASGEVCAWAECQQIARPRSKYCSRNCSNKNARARHKARK